MELNKISSIIFYTFVFKADLYPNPHGKFYTTQNRRLI